MSQVYGYKKPVRRSRAHRRSLTLTLVAVFLVSALAGAYFYDDWRNEKASKPSSQVQNQQITASTKIFRTTYFQFKDDGNWVLNAKETTENKYIFYKYRGLLVEHQLVVYVNEVPIPLYLAVARALPVRVVNANSFDILTVSEPCGRLYASGEPHRIKSLTINGAEMLCDPDTPLYNVVLSEISGDYRLDLKRLDGSAVQLVITYRDMTLEPGPDTIKNIATSFQAL